MVCAGSLVLSLVSSFKSPQEPEEYLHLGAPPPQVLVVPQSTAAWEPKAMLPPGRRPGFRVMQTHHPPVLSPRPDAPGQLAKTQGKYCLLQEGLTDYTSLCVPHHQGKQQRAVLRERALESDSLGIPVLPLLVSRCKLRTLGSLNLSFLF